MPSLRVADRTKGRNAKRDQARVIYRNGAYLYTCMPGEDVTTIARWFDVSPMSIPLLLRLPQNKPYLVPAGNGIVTLRRMKGGERVRIPEIWMHPDKPSYPAREGLRRLGADDDGEDGDGGEGTDAVGPLPDDHTDQAGCPPGAYARTFPGCDDGYSWSNYCCIPDGSGGGGDTSGAMANGMPCGSPGAATVWQDGVCSCDEAAGFTYSASQGRCVPVGDPCDSSGGVYNSSGECITTTDQGKQADKYCCPDGGDAVSENRMDGDCNLSGPSKITAAGAPECTKYDACKDDFIPIPGCTPAKKPTGGGGGGGTPSGGGGTPAKKGTPGKKPPAKKGAAKGKAKAGGKEAEAKAKGWSTGAKALAGVAVVGVLAAGGYATRKKWMPKKLPQGCALPHNNVTPRNQAHDRRIVCISSWPDGRREGRALADAARG